MFDECVLAAFVLTGTIWLVDAIGQSVILEPNQLMRGRELASEIRERIPDRVVDLRVTCSVGSSCRRRSRSTILVGQGDVAGAETLAELREIGERILLLSFADHGKRGILAITDRRLIHVSHARTDRRSSRSTGRRPVRPGDHGLRGARPRSSSTPDRPSSTASAPVRACRNARAC